MYNEQTFKQGFIKRAAAYGIDISKEANDGTSFIGRYLASKSLGNTAQQNYMKIMDEVDPKHEIPTDQPLFGDNYKKYRHATYDHVKPSLKRNAAGSVGTSTLWGGLGGAAIGGLRGGLQGSTEGHTAGGAGIGALIGGGIGAGAGALGNLLSKLKNNAVTHEDTKRMQHQQADRSLLSNIVPFRDVYDSYKAGK